ncbi:MAG: DUF1611 domain-containing protein [Spirulinaceae cyanobacterium RM2_2_10]|nr:DUF1611 domain-containing protein [Spirulinaceae cyanobacterium SM2_1_0]NJO20018.1 DUF1611 domain-containing protein [Spirulinaceae cyanobacterium RM2_2_10]
MRLTTATRVAILMHAGLQGISGKTGLAYLRYGEATVVAVIDSEAVGRSLAALTGIDRDVPIVGSVAEALVYEPDVLLIGIAPSGGGLPEAWLVEVRQAIAAGLSLVNGLHRPLAPLATDLSDDLQPGQWIWDIRQEPAGLRVGSGAARSLTSQRVLTVGTDMAIGKMSTGLELWRAARAQGWRAEFVATGQGGLAIAGQGVPLDAVRVDFAAGAVEQAVLAVGQDCELLFIEGQGSLLHPGSTATLPLLRGSQATDLILVHRAGQLTVNQCPDVVIPPLPDVVALYEQVSRAAGAFPGAQVRGVALNTQALTESEARQAIAQAQQDTGLPCTDAVRFGPEPLLTALLASQTIS